MSPAKLFSLLQYRRATWTHFAVAKVKLNLELSKTDLLHVWAGWILLFGNALLSGTVFYIQHFNPFMPMH